MNAYEKIRAALEQARQLIPEYCGIRTQYDDAFAALDELERAAAEPLFILTTGAIDSDGEQDDWDIECDSARRLESFCAAYPSAIVKLYAAPPAPVADIAELRAKVASTSNRLIDVVIEKQEAEKDRDQLRAERDELRGEIARHERNNTHIGKFFDQLRSELAVVAAELNLERDVCANQWAELKDARARLAAIDGAPAIARIESLPGPRGKAYLYIMGVESPPNVSSGTELIARPAKD